MPCSVISFDILPSTIAERTNFRTPLRVKLHVYLELLCCRLMCDLRAFLVLHSFRQNWQMYPEDSTCFDSTCSNREVLNLVWWPQSAHLHTTPFSVLSLTIFSSTAAKTVNEDILRKDTTKQWKASPWAVSGS